MAAHSVLGASSASRWMACPGSVELIKRAPVEADSPYAAEGTAAHELAEKCLKAKTKKKREAMSYLGQKIPVKMASGTVEFEVTQEMAGAVQVYVDFVFEKAKGRPLEIEKRFKLDWLFPGMFGTNDACASEEFGNLDVFDYKHGAGVPVEAIENKQLLYYALGAAYDVERGCFKDFDTVTMWIVQPRCHHEEGPIRGYEVSMDEIKAFAKTLKEAAVVTTQQNAKLEAGDHCKWCRAKAICPALREKALETAQGDFSGVLPMPETLDDDQIAKVVANGKLLVEFVEACKSYATSRLAQGHKLPGVKLVRGNARKAWTEGVQDKLVEMIGEKVLETKLRSVSQVLKLAKKDQKEQLKGLYIEQPGGISAAPSTDRRKAVDLSGGDAFPQLPNFGGSLE